MSLKANFKSHFRYIKENIHLKSFGEDGEKRSLDTHARTHMVGT